jgi:6-phosphogluconolactonase
MIRVCADPEVLSNTAAELFAAAARRAIAAHGRFAVALAGGETPRRTYELLAAPSFRERVPWQNIHVFWGDERCVPADDPRSNALMARRALLDLVPVQAANIHPIPCAGDPQQSATDYERLLRAFFANGPPRFDLVFLGLGEDGHTASLFPGSNALAEKRLWTAVASKSGEEFSRVTLTVPCLNRAEQVVFLVAGATKAPILKEVLAEAPGSAPLPAQLIRPTEGELVWLVDRAAARLLPSINLFNLAK